jgi:hypothetical protein
VSSLDLPAYELVRLQLEEQLRRDFELLYQAHLTKLRAYETLARARGEIDASLPPLALTLNLPGLLPAAAAPALPAPAPPPAAAPPAAPAPAVPPAPSGKAKPAKRKRDRNYRLHDAVREALDQLGETFTKQDLGKVLGFRPTRTTLHSVLAALVTDGTLRLEGSEWGRANRYRQATAPPAEPEPPVGEE